jgi:OOP family OmpA-OmpF porin
VVGHTDSVGSEQYNQVLSEKRAFIVASYLINKGLPADKVIQRGEGEQQPIATNETTVGRAKNRRVEIKIIHFKKK